MCKDSGDGNNIIENVKASLDNVSVGYFDTGASCPYARYDLYFKDKNKEVRRSAITAFTLMLGTWHAGSGYTFVPQHLRKFTRGFENAPWAELHNYLKAFVTHSHSIQQEFPVMYAYIIWFFIHIEDGELLTYEEKFPELDAVWCSRLRKELLQPNALIQMPKLKQLFQEARIPPYSTENKGG